MILSIESNFILEHVLGQSEGSACEALLELSKRSLTLCVPAFAIAEAAMVVERRRGERRDFMQRQLQAQLQDANRSAVLARFAPALAGMKAELQEAEVDERARMQFFYSTELESLHVLPLTTLVLGKCAAYQLAGEIEKFPDALIFASVITAMEEIPDDPKYFVSRDERFKSTWCLDQLRSVGCNFLSSFNDALAVARRHET
jgi:predicted nucleic acid-binding protein